MKAIYIHGRGGPDHLVYEDAPQPHPGSGEVLVRVYATGIIANELKWDVTYQTTTGSPRTRPIPGRDLSGEVEEVGPGVTHLVKGAKVYAMLGYGRDGAEADYTLALPSELAPKPITLDPVQAAAVPLSALTAWQALFDHAHLGCRTNRPDPRRRRRRWSLCRPTCSLGGGAGHRDRLGPQSRIPTGIRGQGDHRLYQHTLRGSGPWRRSGLRYSGRRNLATLLAGDQAGRSAGFHRQSSTSRCRKKGTGRALCLFYRRT